MKVLVYILKVTIYFCCISGFYTNISYSAVTHKCQMMHRGEYDFPYSGRCKKFNSCKKLAKHYKNPMYSCYLERKEAKVNYLCEICVENNAHSCKTC